MMPRRWAIVAMAIAIAWGTDANARDHGRKHPAAPRHASKPQAKAKAPGKGKARTPPAAIEDEVAADSDFERRAAELRNWLRQREEERRLEGDIGNGIPEEYVTPMGGIVREHKAKTAPGHRPAAAPSVNGRQRHVLDPSQPIVLRGTRVTTPEKPPAATRKSPATLKKAR